MNVYEVKSMAERLDGNTYPGRGIVLGITPDGKTAVAAYFIMGRSVNSRNRVFCLEPDGIRTEAHDPALMKDPHLIIYHPVREIGQGLIVTNGDQTDTIWEYLAKGESWEAALRTRQFEDDGPNWTPRISGLQAGDGSYKMSILKAADAAALGLTENPLQPDDRYCLRSNDIAEYISRSYAGQLVGIADQDQGHGIPQRLEQVIH